MMVQAVINGVLETNCIKRRTKWKETTNEDISYFFSKFLSLMLVISFWVGLGTLISVVLSWIIIEVLLTIFRFLAGFLSRKYHNDEVDVFERYLGPSLTIRLFKNIFAYFKSKFTRRPTIDRALAPPETNNFLQDNHPRPGVENLTTEGEKDEFEMQTRS